MYATRHLFRSAKSAVLHIVASTYQAIRWQQRRKQFYSLSTPTASCEKFLYSHEKIREMFCLLQIQYVLRKHLYWISMSAHYITVPPHNYILHNSWEVGDSLVRLRRGGGCDAETPCTIVTTCIFRMCMERYHIDFLLDEGRGSTFARGSRHVNVTRNRIWYEWNLCEPSYSCELRMSVSCPCSSLIFVSASNTPCI
jgi:hypothetical protein